MIERPPEVEHNNRALWSAWWNGARAALLRKTQYANPYYYTERFKMHPLRKLFRNYWRGGFEFVLFHREHPQIVALTRRMRMAKAMQTYFKRKFEPLIRDRILLPEHSGGIIFKRLSKPKTEEGTNEQSDHD